MGSNGEYGTLAYCGGKLFYRSVNLAPAACVALDLDTLCETNTYRTNVEGCSLPPALPLAGGDASEYEHLTSPLFSDGHYLYTVLDSSSATAGATTATPTRGSKKDDARHRFVLEMYDPRQGLVLVRRVELPQAPPASSQTNWCSTCQRFPVGGTLIGDSFVFVDWCCCCLFAFPWPIGD